MANKNECYLCGGKLRGGYCPACGLDNTKIHRKHYHLNESYTVESMNGDAGQASEKCGYKAEQDTGSFETEKKASLFLNTMLSSRIQNLETTEEIRPGMHTRPESQK